MASTISRVAAQVHSDDPVDHFRLAIRLGVEGGGEVELSVGVTEKVASKGVGEDGITVTNDGGRKAMQAHDVVKKAV